MLRTKMFLLHFDISMVTASEKNKCCCTSINFPKPLCHIVMYIIKLGDGLEGFVCVTLLRYYEYPLQGAFLLIL
jgi:hypothetical protein